MRFLLLILITFGIIRASERADVVWDQFLSAMNRCRMAPFYCFIGGKAPIELHPYPTEREREIVNWLKASNLREIELLDLNLEPEESMALTTDIFPILIKSKSEFIITQSQ